MVMPSGGDETLNYYFASQLRAPKEGKAKFPSCDGQPPPGTYKALMRKRFMHYSELEDHAEHLGSASRPRYTVQGTWGRGQAGG